MIFHWCRGDYDHCPVVLSWKKKLGEKQQYFQTRRSCWVCTLWAWYVQIWHLLNLLSPFRHGVLTTFLSKPVMVLVGFPKNAMFFGFCLYFIIRRSLKIFKLLRCWGCWVKLGSQIFQIACLWLCELPDCENCKIILANYVYYNQPIMFWK